MLSKLYRSRKIISPMCSLKICEWVTFIVKFFSVKQQQYLLCLAECIPLPEILYSLLAFAIFCTLEPKEMPLNLFFFFFFSVSSIKPANFHSALTRTLTPQHWHYHLFIHTLPVQQCLTKHIINRQKVLKLSSRTE